MQPWRVVARNLASHATNPIHTDAGARAAGYPSALVAGVTVHAWLTHPPVAAWGDDWLRAGSGSVRFRRPVFDGDVVDVVPGPTGTPSDGSVVVRAMVDGEVRAELVTRPPGTVPGTGPVLPGTPRHERLVPDATRLQPGQDLGSIPFVLGGAWGASYAVEVGDDLDRYRPGHASGDVVHPGVWLEAAHLAFTRNLALASWIHTESTYQHRGALVAADTAVNVRSRVREATVRKGRDELILDVQIVDAVTGDVLVTVDHRAIVRLP